MATVEQAQASMKKVADVIAYAANKSATDVRLMGETFKYAAPMATALGMSMDELGAAAMIMANNGIKGSEAGVAIRSGMVRLLRPTKEMQSTLARLNIDLADFKKKGHDITAKELIDALQADGIDATKLTDKIGKALADPGLKAAPQRMVAELVKIIGDGLGSSSIMDKDKLAEHLTDTLTAAGSTIDLLGFIKALTDRAGPEIGNVIARVFDVRQGARLMTLSAGDVKTMLKGIIDGSAGYAEKGTAIMLQGTVGAVERLGTALGAFFVQLSQSGVFDALADGAKSATSFFQRMSESSPALLKWGTYAIMAGASLGILKTALKGVVGMFTLMRSSATLLRAAGFLVLGPWGSLAAILGTIAAYNWGAISAHWNAFSSGFSEGWAEKIKIPDSVGQSWHRFASAFERTTGVNIDLKSWREMGQAFGGGVAWGVNQLAWAFEHLCDAMTKAIELAGRAKGAFGGGSSALKGSGLLKAIPGMAGITGPLGALSGARASGGPVSGGRSYLVGERGPEIFTPRGSGSIIPNGTKGGGGQVTVNNMFHVASTANVHEIAREVERRIKQSIDESMRGLRADYGLGWA